MNEMWSERATIGSKTFLLGPTLGYFNCPKKLTSLIGVPNENLDTDESRVFTLANSPLHNL